MLDFKDYHEASRKTAVYPNQGGNPQYAALGLAEEAGEVAGKVKKLIRDRGGVMTEEWREMVKKELGDVLWYVSACCFEFGLDMEDVAIQNLVKLNERKENGTLHGEGDDR